MFVYCNTMDSPRTVGEIICRANSVEKNRKSWILKDAGDSCVIEANTNGYCVGVVYCVGDSVVGIEIDTHCSSRVIEPLIKKYDFENVKWLIDN